MLDDESCLKESFCILRGHCSVYGQRCWITKHADCQKTHGCKKKGTCTAKNPMTRDAQCVAEGDDCKATKQCKRWGKCTAREGGCVVGVNDCQKAEVCQDDGECTAVKGECIAKGDDCRGSKACKAKGRCTAENGECIAKGNDCKGSQACRNAGLCTSTGTRCIARGDDCKASKVCRNAGLCTSTGTRCIARGDDCKASKVCREDGLCTSTGTRCVARDDDCKASKVCREDGLCTASFGSCSVVRNDNAQATYCQASTKCTEDGLCTPARGGCKLTQDSDCAQSRLCGELGRCYVSKRARNDIKCIAKYDSDCTDRKICTYHGACLVRNGICLADSQKSCSESPGCLKDGECTLFAGLCRARKNEDCTDKKICTHYGQCMAKDNACRADSQKACTESPGCLEDGHCKLVKGQCQAITDADCAHKKICTHYGQCMAKNGVCKADSQALCRASTACLAEGRCTVLEERCQATKDEECTGTRICTHHGQCVAKGGLCKANSQVLCSKSTGCRKEGECTLLDEKCQATKDQHCIGKTICRQRGQCVAQGGKCKADSQTVCNKSLMCRREGECTLVDGDCQATTDEQCLGKKICTVDGRCKAIEGRCQTPKATVKTTSDAGLEKSTLKASPDAGLTQPKPATSDQKPSTGIPQEKRIDGPEPSADQKTATDPKQSPRSGRPQTPPTEISDPPTNGSPRARDAATDRTHPQPHEQDLKRTPKSVSKPKSSSQERPEPTEATGPLPPAKASKNRPSDGTETKPRSAGDAAVPLAKNQAKIADSAQVRENRRPSGHTLKSGRTGGEVVSSMFALKGKSPSGGAKQLAKSWNQAFELNPDSTHERSGNGIESRTCDRSGSKYPETPAIEKTHEALMAGDPIPDELLVRAFIDLDAFRYQKCLPKEAAKQPRSRIVAQVIRLIDRARAMVDTSQPETLGTVKNLIVGPAPMKYELSHRRVASLLVEKRLNCESATYAVILAWLSGRKGVEEPRPALLYQPGHVRPALYEPKAKVLYLTEATTQGSETLRMKLPIKGSNYLVADAKVMMLGSVAELRDDTFKIWQKTYSNSAQLYSHRVNQKPKKAKEAGKEYPLQVDEGGPRKFELEGFAYCALFLGGLFMVVLLWRGRRSPNQKWIRAQMRDAQASPNTTFTHKDDQFQAKADVFVGGATRTFLLFFLTFLCIVLIAALWYVKGDLWTFFVGAGQFIWTNFIILSLVAAGLIFGGPYIAPLVDKSSNSFVLVIGSLLAVALLISLIALVSTIKL